MKPTSGRPLNNPVVTGEPTVAWRSPGGGREYKFLKALAEADGSMTRVDLIKVIKKQFNEEGFQIFKRTVKPAISRLRQLLRKALGLSGQDNPILWDKSIKGYRVRIEIGFAVRDDQNRTQFRRKRGSSMDRGLRNPSLIRLRVAPASLFSEFFFSFPTSHSPPRAQRNPHFLTRATGVQPYLLCVVDSGSQARPEADSRHVRAAADAFSLEGLARFVRHSHRGGKHERHNVRKVSARLRLGEGGRRLFQHLGQRPPPRELLVLSWSCRPTASAVAAFLTWRNWSGSSRTPAARNQRPRIRAANETARLVRASPAEFCSFTHLPLYSYTVPVSLTSHVAFSPKPFS